MISESDRRELLRDTTKNMQRCEAYGHLWRDIDKINAKQKGQSQYCKRCRRNRTKPDNQYNEPTGW